MDIKKVLDRINELYKKQTGEGLTEKEKLEQAELRKIYIKNFRENFRAQLDGIKVVDAEGEVKKSKDKLH